MNKCLFYKKRTRSDNQLCVVFAVNSQPLHCLHSCTRWNIVHYYIIGCDTMCNTRSCTVNNMTVTMLLVSSVMYYVSSDITLV